MLALGHPRPEPGAPGGRLAAATAVVKGIDGRQAAATDLFQQALDRTIDPSGKAYWSNKLITITRPEMLARITGSSEYYRKAGGTIPTFVDAVYQSVLGRSRRPVGPRLLDQAAEQRPVGRVRGSQPGGQQRVPPPLGARRLRPGPGPRAHHG